MRKTNVHQGNPSTARTLWFSLIACVLFIAFIPSNSAFGQNTIACGETKTGTISTAGQMDSYTFQGASGDAVVIAVAATSGSRGAKAALYNPSGTRIAENGYYGNGPTASVTLPVSGTYTI